MTEQLRDAQDAAVASAGDRQIVPEEGGVAGRAARAHDEAAAALEIGDVDRAIVPSSSRGVDGSGCRWLMMPRPVSVVIC